MSGSQAEALRVAVDALSDIRSGADDPTTVAALALDDMAPDEGSGSPLIVFVSDMSSEEPTVTGPICSWQHADHGLTTVRLDLRADLTPEQAAWLSEAVAVAVHRVITSGTYAGGTDGRLG